MGEVDASAGHVFLSYVREDTGYADLLQQALESAGIRVWRDTADLWPGEDWRAKIRHEITKNALVFIACFSRQSLAREVSYQNEELALAIELMRLRWPDLPWLIPVRFDDCEIPERTLGNGRTLETIQCADLFGDRAEDGTARLVAAVRRILSRNVASLNLGVASTDPAGAAVKRLIPTALGKAGDSSLTVSSPGEAVDGPAAVSRGSELDNLAAYVDAACRAAARQSYLRAAPLLPSVYLHQLTLRLDADAGSGDAAGISVMAPVSAESLADGDDDCIVVAGPGMGKSSLLRMLLIMTAERWAKAMPDTLVPVRVMASELAGDARLSELIARSAWADLAAVEFEKRWPLEFFAEAPCVGRGWLVLVDGLDEILDPEIRQGVLAKLAFLGRRDQQVRYRVVAATRSLPEGDLRSIAAASDWRPRVFGLRPLGADDVRQLAENWFKVLDVPDPAGVANRFAADLDHQQLAELAGTPLVAAMLCQLRATAPDGRELPRSRGAIYQQFLLLMHKNLYADRSGVQVQLLSTLTRYNPEAASVAEQVIRSRTGLIACLASRRRAGDTAAALDIIGSQPQARRPDQVPADEWREFLTAVLRRSGLLDTRSDDFVFLHQTFVDYFAAAYDPERMQQVRHFLRIKKKRREYSWKPPRMDPSYLSFLFDPGEPDRGDDSAVQDSIEIGQLFERLADHGGMSGWRFIAEQKRLGTAIPKNVISKVVERLNEVAATTESHFRFQGLKRVEAARAVADIDMPRGIRLLESLALEPSMESCYADAAREVIALAPARAIRLLVMLVNRAPDDDRRVWAATMLAEFDQDQAADVLESLAEDNPMDILRSLTGGSPMDIVKALSEGSLMHMPPIRLRSRVDAAIALCKLDSEVGTEYLESFARSEEFDPGNRTRAACLLAEHDRILGVDLAEAAVAAAIRRAIDFIADVNEFNKFLDNQGDYFLTLKRTPDEHRAKLREEAGGAVGQLAGIDDQRAAALLRAFIVASDLSEDDRSWLSVISTNRREPPVISIVERYLGAYPSQPDRQWFEDQLAALPSIDWELERDPDPEFAYSDRLLPPGLVASLRDPRSADYVYEKASDRTLDSTDRWRLLWQLSRFRDVRAADALAEFSGDAKIRLGLRRAAARELAKSDPARAVKLLVATIDFGKAVESLDVVEAIAEVDFQQGSLLFDRLLRETAPWKLLPKLIIFVDRGYQRRKFSKHSSA